MAIYPIIIGILYWFWEWIRDIPHPIPYFYTQGNPGPDPSFYFDSILDRGFYQTNRKI